MPKREQYVSQATCPFITPVVRQQIPKLKLRWTWIEYCLEIQNERESSIFPDFSLKVSGRSMEKIEKSGRVLGVEGGIAQGVGNVQPWGNYFLQSSAMFV